MESQAQYTTGYLLQDQLLDLFLFLGTEWVLWLLMVLSVISVAITIERIIHFARNSEDVDAVGEALQKSLDEDSLDEARASLSTRNSHVAHVLTQGLTAVKGGPKAAEEAMASATLRERLKMERGLAFLGTLGNNAPYIGLFGTVLGIIRAFRDLAENTLEGSEAVMSGIAEALVATAVGLLVALPAVAIFNVFQRRIRSTVVATDALSRVILSH
ncbi:MAG: MotA/TolQ/ExbB proton channel family protein, partial [Myxococcota bacterium]